MRWVLTSPECEHRGRLRGGVLRAEPNLAPRALPDVVSGHDTAGIWVAFFPAISCGQADMERRLLVRWNALHRRPCSRLVWGFAAPAGRPAAAPSGSGAGVQLVVVPLRDQRRPVRGDGGAAAAHHLAGGMRDCLLRCIGRQAWELRHVAALWRRLLGRCRAVQRPRRTGLDGRVRLQHERGAAERHAGVRSPSAGPRERERGVRGESTTAPQRRLSLGCVFTHRWRGAAGGSLPPTCADRRTSA